MNRDIIFSGMSELPFNAEGWDAYNNMPITRRGITATPLHVDFENAPRFLIDAAIYGGSSGTPVFVFNQGSYTKPDGGLYAGIRF